MVTGRRLVVTLLCVLAPLGCATGGSDKPLHADNLPGTWHTVEPGETSATIAKQAGIPVEDFLEINGLRKNDVLTLGQPVFVLGKSAEQPGSNPGSTATHAQATTSPATSSSAPLRWPVAAPRLSSPFGKRWGKEHEGIDMAAPIGTPVYAASSGDVIYAGDQVRGYGNMVVIRHRGDLVTVYAHNSLLLVHIGDQVSLGQEIARVGDTGRATAPHLHFEVRRNEIPQDPMQFLPALK